MKGERQWEQEMLGVRKGFHKEFSEQNKENEKRELFGIRKECLVVQIQILSLGPLCSE